MVHSKFLIFVISRKEWSWYLASFLETGTGMWHNFCVVSFFLLIDVIIRGDLFFNIEHIRFLNLQKIRIYESVIFRVVINVDELSKINGIKAIGDFWSVFKFFVSLMWNLSKITRFMKKLHNIGNYWKFYGRQWG